MDAVALDMARDAWQVLGLPQGEMLYPYDAKLSRADPQAIKQAGYSAVPATDHYPFWFGWIRDWGNRAGIENWRREFREIHQVDDQLFFGVQGFAWYARWNELGVGPGWILLRYESFVGTDGGLSLYNPNDGQATPP